jgi:hypothetical protein
MLCEFKYLNDDNVWTNFGDLVSPVNFGDILKNEVTTAYNVRLYFKGLSEVNEDVLVPGTIVKIDFGTTEYQFVIVDGGKIDSKTTNDYCYHSYVLQELLAITREVFIESAFFSQGLYTLTEFLDRLIALSYSDREITYDTTGGYQVLLDNWNSPDFPVSSNSLLDNLIKFGQSNSVRVKARINASNQIELYFVSLYGGENISVINGQLVNGDSHYLAANYAGQINSIASNMSDSKLTWYPNPSVFRGLLAEPDAEALEIQPDTAVVRTSYNIKNASKLRFLGFGKVITDSDTEWSKYSGQNYKVFDADQNWIQPDSGKHVKVDYNQYCTVNVFGEIDILAESKWKTLDVDSSNGASIHRENSVYFTPESNKVKNIKVLDGGGDTTQKFNSGYICYVELYDSGGFLIRRDYIYPEFKWEGNKYIVHGDFYINALVNVDNGLKTSRSAIYAQEENLISADAYLNNLNNYAASMKNKENSKVYQFESVEDIPIVGSVYNGQVISQIVCNAYYDYIDATISLSDDVVKKSEYLNADDGIELPKIDIDKAYDRFTNFKTNMHFCESYNQASTLLDDRGIDDILVKPGYIEYFLNSIENGRTINSVGFAEANIKFNPIFTSIAPKVTIANNSLMVSFKSINNVAIGYLRNTDLGSSYSDIRFFPVAFSDGEKEPILHIKFRTGRLPGWNDYPIIPGGDFNADLGKIAEIYKDDYHRDPQEVLNINYQINAKTANKENYIRRSYWEESTIVNDLFFNDDIFDRSIKLFIKELDGSISQPISWSSQALNNINITEEISGIYKVSILYAENYQGAYDFTSANNYTYAVVKRKNTNTLVEENLLKLNCEVEVVNNDIYINYYVAFTK